MNILNGQYLTWDAVLGDWVPTTPPDPSGGAYDALYVRKDTTTQQVMNARLVVPDNGLLVGPSTNQLVVAGGNVGIGTSNPTNKLHVVGGNVLFDNPTNWLWNKGRAFIGNYGSGAGTYDGYDIANLHIFDTISTQNGTLHTTGLSIWKYFQGTENTISSRDTYGIRMELGDLGGTTANLYGFQGFRPFIVHYGSGNLQQLIGINLALDNRGPISSIGASGETAAFCLTSNLKNTSTINGNAYNYRASGLNNTGTINGNHYTFIAGGHANIGTITGGSFGFYSSDYSGHANGWNFYSVGAGSRNYFEGSVGIGTTVLTYALNVAGDVSATNFRGNGTTLTGIELAIVAGLTSQYYRGDKSWQTLNTTIVPEGTNLYYTQARFDTAFAAKTTTNLAEGTNLYYTQTRFDTAFAGKTTTNLAEGTNLYWTQTRFDTAFAGKTTTNLAEGTNLYWTQTRFDTAFAGKTTTNLAEGTNLYFTTARARASVSGTTNQVNYNATTGVFSTPQDIHTAASPAFANLTIGTTALVVTGGNVSIGTASSSGYKLYVNGTSYFNGAQSVNGDMSLVAATSNLFMKDGTTGFTVGTTNVINILSNNNLRSSTYTSGLVGWNISNTLAEFENIRARGEIVTAVFKANEITATSGTVFVPVSSSTLFSDFVSPSAVAGTGSMVVKNADNNGALFSTNSRLRIKTWTTGTTYADCWFTVTSVTNNGTTSTLGVTLQSGTTSATLRAGTAVIDYGSSGSGNISLSSDGAIGSTPNITMATHAGSPWSSQTTLMRMGNLNGSYGYGSNTYGMGVGQYGAANVPWLTVDTTNGIRMGGGSTGTATLAQWDVSGNVLVGSSTGSNVFITSTGLNLRAGSTTRSNFNTDGSGWLANSSIAWNTSGNLTITANATIAGWTVTSNKLSNGNVVIAAGSDVALPSSGNSTAWFGKASATNPYVGIDLRKDESGINHALQMVAGNGTLRPYLYLHSYNTVAGTVVGRVVIGELNNAYNVSDPAVNGIGMKIWSSTGTKLVEFSDVRNIIANWTIDNARISNNSVYMDAGTTDGLIANVTRTWFGYTNWSGGGSLRGLDVRYYPGSGTADYGFQVVSNTNVDGGKPYMMMYDSRHRIIIGSMNYTWNGYIASSGMGMKIFGTSGDYLVEFSDARNVIAGWDISQSTISSTGVALRSGASANIAFGATPPTSSSSGTGTFMDATGFYGLSGGTAQVSVSASDGKLRAGNGSVILDNSGINLVASSSYLPSSAIKWTNSGLNALQMNSRFDSSSGHWITDSFIYSYTNSASTTGEAYLTIGAVNNSGTSNSYIQMNQKGTGFPSTPNDSSLTVSANTVTVGNGNFVNINGISGDVRINSGQLYVQGWTGHVGIGTLSPNPLSVAASVYGRVVTVTSTNTTGRAMFELHLQTATTTADLIIGQVNFINGTSGFTNGINHLGAIAVANQTAAVANNGYMSFFTATGGTLTERMRINSAGSLRLLAYGAGTLTTDASGNVTVTSDLRQKDKLGDFTLGLETVRGLQPIIYKWKQESGNDPNAIYYGFSAQNVHKVLPGAVGRTPEGWMTLQDRPLIAVTVNAVKEIDQTVESLKLRVAELEAKLANVGKK